MTYLAPRQGLFAVILLISFCLQTVLLIISTSGQLDAIKMQTGERMLSQLVDEVKLPLMSQDEVSLGVLAGRYASESSVASLSVSDSEDKLLVQTGQDQLADGEIIHQNVMLEDRVIGEVAMTLKDTSNGEILASQWVFIVGSLIIHVLLWLLYGYIARPTKAQLATLSRDIQDYLIDQDRIQKRHDRTSKEQLAREERLANERQSQEQDPQEKPERSIIAKLTEGNQRASQSGDITSTSTAEKQVNSQDESLDTSSPSSVNNVHHAINDYVQSQRNQDNNPAVDKEVSSISINPQKNTQSDGLTNRYPLKTDRLSASRPLDSVTVQLAFVDKFDLLDKLAPEPAKLYLTLCQQLLDQTINKVLSLPRLQGIQSHQSVPFGESGAMVELTAQPHAKNQLALAGVMLAKAMLMANQVVCKDSRRLKRFALDMKAGVSDTLAHEQMRQLLAHHNIDSDVLVLLPSLGLTQLKGQIELAEYPNPMTVAERDCAVLAGVNDARMADLVDIRRAVLLPEA